MGFTLDIPEEYKALYGVRADEFNVKENARGALGSSFYKKDKFGRWYFMPVTLGGVELWNPIMRVMGRKVIVETPMVERKGSVREIINVDDYVINIRGIIRRPDGVFPESELTELKNLFERNQAIPIESAITSIFLNGAENVVITNFTMPEKPGQTEAVLYELEMASDIFFDLEINE